MKYQSPILSAAEIRALCIGTNSPMISPFSEQYHWNNLSAGLDYNGYCSTLGGTWVTNDAEVIDFANLAEYRKHNHEIKADRFELEPHGCVLAVSEQKFKMPNDIMALSFGKSTIARGFATSLMTPIEAGWEGYLTYEIVNLNPKTRAVLYRGMVITQFIFLRVALSTGYTGQYQNQPNRPISAAGMPITTS